MYGPGKYSVQHGFLHMHGAEERANQLSWGERKLPSGEYLSNVTFSFETPQPQMTFLPQCTMRDHVVPLKSHMSVQKGEKKKSCAQFTSLDVPDMSAQFFGNSFKGSKGMPPPSPLSPRPSRYWSCEAEVKLGHSSAAPVGVGCGGARSAGRRLRPRRCVEAEDRSGAAVCAAVYSSER